MPKIMMVQVCQNLDHQHPNPFLAIFWFFPVHFALNVMRQEFGGRSICDPKRGVAGGGQPGIHVGVEVGGKGGFWTPREGVSRPPTPLFGWFQKWKFFRRCTLENEQKNAPFPSFLVGYIAFFLTFCCFPFEKYSFAFAKCGGNANVFFSGFFSGEFFCWNKFLITPVLPKNVVIFLAVLYFHDRFILIQMKNPRILLF